MKILLRMMVVALLLTLTVVSASARDGAPKDSGAIVWFVPEFHVYDIMADYNYEDDLGSKTETADDSFRINQSGGLGIMVSYVTPSPFFISLEAAHHVYLYKTDRDLFDDTGLTQGMSKDVSNVNFRIKSTRVGGLVGVYLTKSPARVFIQAGGDADFNVMTAFGRDADAMVFNASGLLGVDYFISEHFGIGTGLRVDYMLNEEYTKKFSKFGDDHDVTATFDRIPMNWVVRFGYMF